MRAQDYDTKEDAMRRVSWFAALTVLATTLATASAATPAAAAGTMSPAQMIVATTTPPMAAGPTTPTVAETNAYIDAVYLDLFGRHPDPTGLATWGTALLSGTPRRAVADAITNSDEFRTGLITDAYDMYLGRDPEPAGLANWLQRMREGLTIQQMEAGILGSDEYFAGAGMSDGTFIQHLYVDVLGRNCSQDEQFFWQSRLWGMWVAKDLASLPPLRTPPPRKMSRAEIALAFLLSTELLTSQLDADYQYLLGRTIDPSGSATWVGAIQNGVRYEQVIGSIVASDEYYSTI